jgi:hypothetical protein
VPIDRIQSSPKSDVGAVHKATSSAECLDLLTGPREAARWRSGKPGSPTAAFFASAVDASFRTGRLTLHVEDHHDGPVDGLLVLHGSETSAVWRHAGRLGSGPDSPLVQAAMLEAAERGSHRLIWPDSAGVLGKPFSLTDITRVRRKGGRLRELPELARSFVRGFRNYGSA